MYNHFGSNLAAFMKMKNVYILCDPEGVPLPGLQHRETVTHMLQKALPQYCWKYKIGTQLGTL